LRCKIIASLGPSMDSLDIVVNAVLEGASAFRINFTHGDESVWARYVEYVRKAEKITGRFVALIGDLTGPSIRLGTVEPPMVLKKGETAYIVPSEKGSAEKREIPLPSREVFDQLEVGDVIVMDDGKVRMRVSDVSRNRVEVVALTDAVIKSRKALVVTNKEFDLPALTPRDLRNLDFALEKGFDYVALSYVRRGSDIAMLKSILRRKGREDVGVIAKIETRSAIRNLEEIVEAADVVLVARGDLGMNFGLEEVPSLQRYIVHKALEVGKPVIVATQLLESMLGSPVPTRAEVVDITMAVSEGADALMLTGETAVGKYPLEAIRWLRRVIEAAERRFEIARPRKARGVRQRFAKGVTELAEDLDAKLVIFSMRGNTARLVSLLRPRVNFYVGSPSIETLRRISILWGVNPLLVEASSYEEGVSRTYDQLKREGLLKLGELVVLTYGLRSDEQVVRIKRVEP